MRNVALHEISNLPMYLDVSVSGPGRYSGLDYLSLAGETFANQQAWFMVFWLQCGVCPTPQGHLKNTEDRIACGSHVACG